MPKKTYPTKGKYKYTKESVVGSGMTYPADLSGDCDYIQFNNYQYSSSRNRRGGTSTIGPTGPGVKLYMPNSTPRVINQQEWEDKSFPGEKGMMQKELMKKMTGGEANLGDIQYGEAAKQAALDAFLGNFGYDASTAMALSGKQYNPNIEMLYKQPKLRPFDFTFIFAPKNTRDRDAADKIIKWFKTHSAPSLESGNSGYMMVPDLWKIRYMRGGEGEVENERMNKFKGCALTGITVQDNPTQDTHMTFDDGTPAMTAMSLSFVEIDIITREDHESTSGLRGM